MIDPQQQCNFERKQVNIVRVTIKIDISTMMDKYITELCRMFHTIQRKRWKSYLHVPHPGRGLQDDCCFGGDPSTDDKTPKET